MSACVLITLDQQFNTAIFSVPKVLDKKYLGDRKEVAPGREKAPIILICCSCLTITHIFISELPANTS